MFLSHDYDVLQEYKKTRNELLNARNDNVLKYLSNIKEK